MSTLPALNYLSDVARTQGEEKTAFEDFLAGLKQVPGVGIAEATLILSGDAVTPTGGSGGIVSIDTEAAAATDNLANITQTNLPDGSLILVRCKNNARTVVVKHSAGGAGQITLYNGVDYTLDDTKKWLLLKRTGTTWEEVLRFPALGLMHSNVITKTGAYTTTGPDRGKTIRATSGTWTLTLLPAVAAGDGFVQIVQNAGTGVITIDANAAETINSAATVVLDHQYQEVLLLCDGTNWHIIGAYSPLIGSIPVLAKTAAYTVVQGDRGKLIDATSGTWTLSLTAAATFGDNFWFAVRNSGSGTITIDPNSTEQIDGATTITLAQNETAFVICNGTAFKTLGRPAAGGSGLDGARGLKIVRNATTSIADITADEAILSDSSGNKKRHTSVSVSPNTATAGPAANGRDQAGAFTSGAFIYAWLISDGATIAGLWSASATAPTLPTGYTYKLFVAAWKLDASTTVLRNAIQRGLAFRFSTPILDVDVATSSSTAATRTLTTPPLKTEAVLNVLVTDPDTGADSATYLSDPDTDDVAVSDTAAPLSSIRATSASLLQSGQVHVITNDSAQIRTRSISSTGNCTLRIATLGWHLLN